LLCQFVLFFAPLRQPLQTPSTPTSPTMAPSPVTPAELEILSTKAIAAKATAYCE